MKLTIIIPVYNEEKRLPECLTEFLSFFNGYNIDYEILVSADGCIDSTVNIAEKFSKENRRIKVISTSERLGKGGGILNVAPVITGDIICISDVDLSAPPKQIPRILQIMFDKKADVVIGSRNLPDSIILLQPPWYRKFLGKMFNFLFRRLFKVDIYDTQCGFKFIWKEVFDAVYNDLVIEGFSFDIDLIVQSLLKGYKVIEVPIEWSYSSESTVHIFKQIINMGRDLLIVWLESRKDKMFPSPRDNRLFYDSLSGDTYDKAMKAYFIPRRLWHIHKNKCICKKISEESSIVVDAGCGSGNIIGQLQEKSKEVLGIDLGKEFIRFSHKTYSNDKTRFIRADIQFLPLRGEVVDAIICSEVLEHIEEASMVTGEFHRVLRSGGELIITTPKTSLRWSLVESVWNKLRSKVLENRHIPFTKRKLKTILKKTGFRDRNVESFMLGCLLIASSHKMEVIPR